MYRKFSGKMCMRLHVETVTSQFCALYFSTRKVLTYFSSTFQEIPAAITKKGRPFGEGKNRMEKGERETKLEKKKQRRKRKKTEKKECRRKRKKARKSERRQKKEKEDRR